jgi:hypothetical protein
MAAARLCTDTTPYSASPVVRLYRHVLESVFSFCSLAELAAVIRVSKEWAAAVQTMHPLCAALRDRVYPNPSLDFLCVSRLSRHIGSIPWLLSPSVAELPALSFHLPHLHSLCISFKNAWSPLVFPARLRCLDVRFHSPSDDGDEVPELLTDAQTDELVAAIAVIASLPILEELILTPQGAERCCLTPLVDALALRKLVLYASPSVMESPSVIDALRRMPHLRALDFNPTSSSFARLLEEPHEMKLDTLLVSAEFTDEFAAAIVRLPTLTDFSFFLCSKDTDFLSHLPNLRKLELFNFMCTVAPDAGRIIHSFHSLTRLEELRLDGSGDPDGEFAFRFTSEQLADCFAHMPLLSCLVLKGATAVRSLRFLSSGPITRSLKELELRYFQPRLPLSELEYVQTLSSLVNLTLHSAFDRALDAPSLRQYTPPSALFPSLRHFRHFWEQAM